jgi:twitching motility two-component system response regulator PilG
MSLQKAVDLLRQGVALANSGKKTEARDLIRQSLAIDPSEVGWLWLASVSDDPLEIFLALQRTLEINPNNDRAKVSLNSARLRAAITYARAGQKPQAVALLRECAVFEPGNEIVWMWLASAAENRDEIVNALTKALEINPKNDQARASLESHRPKPAVTPRPTWQCPYCAFSSDAKQSICPGCGTMLVLTSVDALIANRKVDEKKLRSGVAKLLERIKVKPDFAVHYYLAIAYLQLQSVEESLAQFEMAVKIQNHDAIRQHMAALEKRKRQRAEAAKPRPAEPAKKMILIVDDSVTIRKLVSMTVTEQGYRAVEAAEGQEALEKIQQEGVPSLIFLDIMMPGMDGYALCKELRAQKATAAIPIVMLSGKDGMFNKMRGRMAGATHYVTKPFQAEALHQVLSQYCPKDSVRVTRS